MWRPADCFRHLQNQSHYWRHHIMWCTSLLHSVMHVTVVSPLSSVLSIHVSSSGFYILVTSKVISGWVLTSDSTHAWWHFSIAPEEDQVACAMTWFPTYYPGIDILLCYWGSAFCPVLIMSNVTLGSKMHQFYKDIGSTQLGFKFPNFLMGSLRSTDSVLVSSCDLWVGIKLSTHIILL